MKTKSNTLWGKMLVFTLMFFIMIPVAMNAQESKSNFSGTWGLNTSKSSLGNGGGGGGNRGGGGGGQFTASGDITVAQEENKLSVTRAAFNRDGGSTPNTTVYSLDGKESVNSSQRGESKSVAVWSSDGKSLTITTNASFNGMNMKTVEVWTIDASNALSIKSDATTPNGNRSTTMVYDKK